MDCYGQSTHGDVHLYTSMAAPVSSPPPRVCHILICYRAGITTSKNYQTAVCLVQAHHLFQAKVMGNKYFVDESPKVRLPEEYALYALQLLEQKLESDISISVSSFAQDFCQPMSTVHSWKKQMLQRFGTAIGNAPAFQRVTRMLTSEGGRLGRQKVVQWFGRKIS